jgi:hypothetical protein
MVFQSEKRRKTCEIGTMRPIILSSFSPPALACMRSWGRVGFNVGFIWINRQGESKPKSRYLSGYVPFEQSLLYSEKGIEVIGNCIRELGGTGIVCIADRIGAWISENRDRLPRGVAVLVPAAKTIGDLLSKRRQIEVAREVGLNVLPTYFVDGRKEGIDLIPENEFPVCLRPDLPGTVDPGFKAEVVATRGKLMDYVAGLRRIDRPLIGQRFMNQANLVVHGARSLTGNTIGLQGFLVRRKFEGLTLTINPTKISEELKAKCIRFTEKFEVTGNYHFEFLVNEDRSEVNFLELNNRLGGTTAKVYACGYDEPLLALKAYGVGSEPHASVKNVVASSNTALVKYLLYTIWGKLTPLDYPSERRVERIAKTIYGLMVYRDDIFDWKDLKGTISLYVANMRDRQRGGGF